jgi:hypothetical protein
MAWYVNQADRFEPVAYPSLYHPGQAIAELKHPAKLLARSPEVVYFGSSFAYASIPQWIDPSYWSEGLQPRFVPKQTLKAVGLSLSALRRIATEHLQLLLLFVLLAGAGYRWRSKVLRDPLVMAVLLWALACILAYAIVYLEGRYIFYNVLVIAVLLACCATVGKTQPKQYPLYPVLLLCAALICVFSLQGAYNSSVEESLMGGRPLQGKYSLPEYQAGEALGKIYPKGQEVACMGDDACSSHPMWIHIAGVRLTGYVDGGNGWGKWEADDSCMGIEGNPAAIEALRARKVRAIVAKFERSQPCSAAWKPLGDAGFFFYRPL